MLGYDVVYTTRLPYLKWSYTEPYGDEILFVGSGGLFEYNEQSKAKENLHRELVHVLKKGPSPITALWRLFEAHSQCQNETKATPWAAGQRSI